MRKFSQKGPRIEQLSLEAKLIYSVFCVMSLAALAVSVIYYYEIVGNSATRGVKQYYAGASAEQGGSANAATQATAAPTARRPTAGPTLDLPDDDTADTKPAALPGKMILRISKRKLLEVTHFHLFTVPVFLLIICHLFMLCRMVPWLKLSLIGTGLGSTTLHLIAPWLIYWGGGAWAWTMPLSGALMGVSLTIMTAWPCIAMWRKPPSKHAAA